MDPTTTSSYLRVPMASLDDGQKFPNSDECSCCIRLNKLAANDLFQIAVASPSFVQPLPHDFDSRYLIHGSLLGPGADHGGLKWPIHGSSIRSGVGVKAIPCQPKL